MLTVYFVLTAGLLPSFVINIAVSVKTVHEKFLFPASEVHDPTSLKSDKLKFFPALFEKMPSCACLVFKIDNK